MADDPANPGAAPATDGTKLARPLALDEFANSEARPPIRPTAGVGAPYDTRHVPSRPPRQRPPLHPIVLGAALLGIGVLIIANVVYIAKLARQSRPSNSLLATQPTTPMSFPTAQAEPEASEGSPIVDGNQAVLGDSPETFADEGVEGETAEEPKPEAPRHYKTVQEAASRSCTTASVEGLSRQIIGEVRCTVPNAFAQLPSRPNLNLGTQVFPFLAAPARDRLVKVLDAHPSETLTINSALRTIAQQYLVWRWSSNRRCGVQLASSPGDSNHESGLAIDIADEAKWRPALEAQDFRWMGTSDRVHFDYKGRGAVALQKVDVLAFQRLWNRNFPKDPIPMDGRYTPAMEERLKKAPPEGFAIGPNCGKRKP